MRGKVQDTMAVTDHGSDCRLACRATITSIIHRKEIDPHTVVNGAEIIVISYYLTVAMEEEDVWGGLVS
jgi:hypothetical protein